MKKNRFNSHQFGIDAAQSAALVAMKFVAGQFVEAAEFLAVDSYLAH